MPDFTQVVYFHCASVEEFSTEVQGSNDKTYKVRLGYAPLPASTKFAWTCECPSFQYRGRCKHIKQVRSGESYCGWQQQIHEGEMVRDATYVARCPKCSNLAIAARHAV